MYGKNSSLLIRRQKKKIHADSKFFLLSQNQEMNLETSVPDLPAFNSFYYRAFDIDYFQRILDNFDEIEETNQNRRKSPTNVSHWLYYLLQSSESSHLIQWTSNKDQGEFKIIDQKALAKLWGCRGQKENREMTYTSLARTMRYHYKRSKNRELQVVRKKMIYRFSKRFLTEIEYK